MNEEFIIRYTTSQLHVRYSIISEYEMNDGSIYNYKYHHQLYYDWKKECVLDLYLKRIKEEPENVVRINTIERSSEVVKTIFHLSNQILHNEKTTAFNRIVTNYDYEVLKEYQYYFINGEKLNKEDWKFYNRKHKLKRITQYEVY